jgi:mRNA interferase MazF
VGMEIKRFEVYLIDLEPTVGSEIKKTRPGLVISPDEMNDSIRTVIIATLTTNIREYPTRSSTSFDNNEGQIVLDQIRTIDKSGIMKGWVRLMKKPRRKYYLFF